jgi:hypothetical protein
MRSGLRFALGLLALVPAFAAAGAGAARPPVALTVTPAHVELAGTARATVRIANTGSARAVVDVSRAGFGLDLRGRPKVVAGIGGRRSAAGWLAFSPRRVAIPPGSSAPVTVTSTLPRDAEPGDHDALVLFTTRGPARGGVAVRMRMGVVVVVRAPGRVVHRLRLRTLRVAGSGRAALTFELLVANAGNVTERIDRSDARLSLFTRGRRMARVPAEPRELRPGTRGIVRFRYAGPLRGRVVARVELERETGEILQRAFRLRL